MGGGGGLLLLLLEGLANLEAVVLEVLQRKSAMLSVVIFLSTFIQIYESKLSPTSILIEQVKLNVVPIFIHTGTKTTDSGGDCRLSTEDWPAFAYTMYTVTLMTTLCADDGWAHGGGTATTWAGRLQHSRHSLPKSRYRFMPTKQTWPRASLSLQVNVNASVGFYKSC